MSTSPPGGLSAWEGTRYPLNKTPGGSQSGSGLLENKQIAGNGTTDLRARIIVTVINTVYHFPRTGYRQLLA